MAYPISMRIVLVGSLLSLTQCAYLNPEIQVIDRQTVMEVEAAGEWPEAEKRLAEKLRKRGPLFLDQNPDAAEEPAYNLLNQDFSNSVMGEVGKK